MTQPAEKEIDKIKDSKQTPSSVAVLNEPKNSSQNIKIVKKDVAQAYKKVEEIVLLFPKHWPIKLHPQSDKLSKDIFAFLKEVGLCKTADDEKLVTAFSLQGYGGYCQPEGDYDWCLFNACYVTLWLLWDDKFVENKERKMSDFSDTIDAMSGKKVLQKDESKMNQMEKDAYLYAKAWENIINKFKSKIKTHCKVVNESIFSRLGEVMRQWIFYALKEASMTEEEKELREFEHYLDQRIVSIGMIPPAILLEMATDTDRTEIWRKDIMQKMVRLSAIIVAIGNELLSFPKDMATDYVNLVNVYMRSRQCNVVEAHRAMVKMNEEAIKEYDKLFDSLEPGEKKQFERWAQYLRMCACGFSSWHTTANRYLKTQIVINDETYLKVTIKNV